LNFQEIKKIPNLISLFRILTVIPCVFLILTDINKYKIYIILLLILMYISDLLDGYLARKLNIITETGKIIDPVADKIAIIALALCIFYKELVPFWFVIIVISRDILILIFGLILTKKYKITLMSNLTGKFAVFTIGLILLLSIVNNELLNTKFSFLYYIVTLIIVYALIIYFIRFKKTIGEK
jgi:CDP-diacylglycerol--glycerol-3-phosphate 3-phosphatidyltransferase